MTATTPIFSHPPALVGHRGLGKGVVAGQEQNTLGSFLGALDAGVDWVEVDVRRTIDDELFVVHDAAFTDGVFLTAMTGSQARAHGALGIEELLEALPPTAGVVFDVKSSLEDAGRPAAWTTAALLARVGDRHLGDRPAVALSFDPAALRHMREQAPRLPLGLLTWLRFPVGHAVAAAAHLDVQLLAVHAGSLWPNAATAPVDLPSLQRVVTSVHESDRELIVWCPADESQVQSLVAAEVDAIVVDDVPRHVQSISRLPQPQAAQYGLHR